MFQSRFFARSVAAATALAGALIVAPSAASANTFTVRWGLPTGHYAIGIDHVGSCDGPTYEQYFEYPDRLIPSSPIMPNPVQLSASCTMGSARMEFYSHPQGVAYDPWAGDGAMVVTVRGSGDIGTVPVPTLGAQGRLQGTILSRNPVSDGQIQVDIFQVTGSPTTSTGYGVDAFSSGPSRGTHYQTGPLWPGQYLAFITDKATGNKATGLVDVGAGTTFDIDLDIVCFGIDNCAWQGGTPTATGSFHPVSPTRIADTRTGLGIPWGAVSRGDGRLPSEPNPDFRAAATQNHQLKVTDVAGVPRVGVSAVLLNVTAADGGSDGSLKVFPKPPRTAVFDDQSSFGTTPTSTQLYWRAGENSANLVLAKVGVGGYVRLENVSYASVNVIIDVVGWYDQGQPGQSGAGLVALTPDRFLDTRNGIGGPKSPFGTDETRSVQVAGRGKVPRNASAVVGTLTGIQPSAITYITAWPGGAARPNASVVNTAPGAIRPNLVTVPPGTGGNWQLYNESGSQDMLLDISGYYTGDGTGGRVTPIEAAPILDSIRGFRGGAMGGGETRSLGVVNTAGVPGDATAVLLNVTVLDGTAWSYMTVYPNGQSLPATSNLNWNPTDRRSNLVLVPVGAGGAVNLYNAFGQVHVAVEIVGWVR